MSPSNEPRGTTLIEVMVAMSVLLIGLLGMMDLQILGLTSNQGARAQMQATQLAREIASALERLSITDARLAATSAFGPLLQANGSQPSSGFTAAADTLPGVRPDSALEDQGSGPVYQRRWTVRDEGADSAVKSVAVSVIYRERGGGRLKEVVLFTGKANGSRVMAHLAAYN
jgi:type IV pilus assembly protein PilV